MPLYEYRCPSGHTLTLLRKMSEADAPVDCECGKPSARAISLPAAGIVVGSSTPVRQVSDSRSGYVEEAPGVWVKGSSIDADKVIDWRCTQCAEKGLAVDEPLPDACPACGSPVETYYNEKARHADWFPHGGYYDRALGVHVETRAHRARLLAEKGLRESDNSEIDDRFRAASAKRAQEDRDIKAMLEEWDDDKERQRGIDLGVIPDHAAAKEIMGM